MTQSSPSTGGRQSAVSSKRRSPVRADIEELEALIGALESNESDAEGYTRREIAKRIGRSDDWVGDKLQELYEDGKLIVGSRRALNIQGRVKYMPVYRLKA